MRFALPLCVVVLAVLGVPRAEASIVLGQSIGGVKLGDPLSSVTQRFGPPSRKVVGDEEGDYGLWWNPIKLHALMRTEGDTVYLVSTTSTKQRTSRHIGPGVRASTARARLTGERCGSYFDADRGRDVVGCDVRAKGGVTTSFVIWSGRVREVVLEPTG
jgi:hypothetical protein